MYVVGFWIPAHDNTAKFEFGLSLQLTPPGQGEALKMANFCVFVLTYDRTQKFCHWGEANRFPEAQNRISVSCREDNLM
jgi:hypothetical protein